jgi:hypothetical protein
MRSSRYPRGSLILRIGRKLRDNRSKPLLESSPVLSLIPLMPEQLMLLDQPLLAASPTTEQASLFDL